MTRKNTSAHRQKPPAPVKSASAYHRLDVLLHTIRCIAQYEDALCELSHDAKRTGGLTPEHGDELRQILDRIPYHDYVLDLDAVRTALDPQPLARSVSRKSATSVPARKHSAVAKKKPGRKPSK